VNVELPPGDVVEVEVDCELGDIPRDELARMQQSLEPIGDAVRDFPHSELWITVVRHPRSDSYNVQAKLKVPGATLFSGDRDTYLDSAFQRCVRKLARKASAYREQPDRQAEERAEDRAGLDRDVVAPEDPSMGPVADAVKNGDYRGFRNALVLYEDWLRKRVGRWVQRYPEAQARVGGDLRIGDLVEEVYLNAFEHFTRRPTDIRLSEWLDRLIDPSLKAMLRHPDEEERNASFARTLRQTPLG
jgi:hypothetical protein